MSLRVTLIQGGGIGLDQVPAVQHILAAAGVAIDWDEHLAGRAAARAGRGRRCRRRCSTRSARTGVALKTKLLPRRPATPRRATTTCSFRRELGLFASVRPLKNLPACRRASTAWTCSSSAS